MNLEEHVPDERELDLKRAELAALATDLVERELWLSTLRQELAAFRAEYLRIVGASYAVLDDTNARLAEASAARRPDDETAQEEAGRARRRAGAAKARAEGQADLEPTEPFDPPAALKTLYRAVARRLHPDLASTDEERVLRGPWMERLGIAYGKQDGNALKSLLAEWEQRKEPARGSEVAGALARAWLFGELTTEDYTDRTRIAREAIEAARQIGRARQRIGDIGQIADDLKDGALYELYGRHRTGLEAGRNLLNEMAAKLEMEAAYTRWEGVVRRDPRTRAMHDAADLPARGLADLERWWGCAPIEGPEERATSESGGRVEFEFSKEQWDVLRPKLDRVFRAVQRELKPGQDLLREFVRALKGALMKNAKLPKHIVKAAIKRWNRETRGGRDVEAAAVSANQAGRAAARGRALPQERALMARWARENPEGVPPAGAGGQDAPAGAGRADAAGYAGAGAAGAESRDDGDGGRSAHETRAESGARGPVVDLGWE